MSPLDPDRLLIDTPPPKRRRRSGVMLEFAEADALRTTVAACVAIVAVAVIVAAVIFHK